MLFFKSHSSSPQSRCSGTGNAFALAVHGEWNVKILWSGREDLNLRLPAPKAGALPGCATPRVCRLFIMSFLLMQGNWAARPAIGIMESELLEVNLVLHARAH